MKKRILFRADGNAQIGAGHMMRCLSIGEAARDMGMECLYVAADNSFGAAIQKKGFFFRTLNTLYSDMDSELVSFETILNQYQPDVILIDSYYVTADYLKWLKGYGKTIYIDDICAFAYPVDMLVNYNIYADKGKYESLYDAFHTARPEMLLGTKYVPLRKEFQLQEMPQPGKCVEDILVSVGGADPEHMALKLLNCFIQENETAGKYKFHFVISSLEPDKGEIRKKAASHSWIMLHENVQYMSDLMLKSDLAISAAGSTLYELAACGIPTITYALADNQLPGALAFETGGIMAYAGDCRRKAGFFRFLCHEIKRLSEDEAQREKMSLSGRGYVDGNGVGRIIREMMRLL